MNRVINIKYILPLKDKLIIFDWLRKRFRAVFFCAFLIFILTVIIVRSYTYVDYFEPTTINNNNLFLSQGEEKKGLPATITIEENCVKASCAPENLNSKTLATITGQDLGANSENKIIDYIVQEGDTIKSIAQDFGISSNTIAWANNISTTTKLKVGQVLIILPVTGTMHLVGTGETLSSITKLYKGSLTEVIAFNELSSEGKVYIGDIVIIPDGVRPAKQTTSSTKIALPNSYFICPVPAPWKISQGLHWYNAVDFTTGQCGSPVFAAAGGTVQITGRQTTAGNYVRILHPNGVVTFYGHLQSISVVPNQTVSQGDIIGYIGHTGYTIPSGVLGCHLHFDVRGAKNPFR